MSSPPHDKDVETLINLGKEAAKRAIRFEERNKFDMAKRAYETAANFLFSASKKSGGRKILETKAAEYRARAQKIYSHVVKKKSHQPTFRLRGGRPDSTAAKMLEKNFGMYFDETGKLRNFKYTTEERYNQVGKLATHVLHDVLKTRYNFSRIPLPETAVSVWGSPGYAEAEVLCVIVRTHVTPLRIQNNAHSNTYTGTWCRCSSSRNVGSKTITERFDGKRYVLTLD